MGGGEGFDNIHNLKIKYVKKNKSMYYGLSKTAGLRNTSLVREEGAPDFHTLPPLVFSSHHLVIRKPERETIEALKF